MLKMTTFKNLTVLAATAAFVAAGYKASAQDDLDDLLNDLAGSDTAVEKKAEEPAKPAEPAVATPAPAPAENASADILSDDPAPAPAQTATAEPVAEAKEAAPAPEAVAADAEPKAEEPAKVAADENKLVTVRLNRHGCSGYLGLNVLGDPFIELTCKTDLFFGHKALLCPTDK